MSSAPARTIPLARPPTSSTSARIGAPAFADSSDSVVCGCAERMIRWSSVSRT